jgi:hypothetical protein
MYDDDDFPTLLWQRNDEPPTWDEHRTHEAIEQYLRKRVLNNFIRKDGPRGLPAPDVVAFP